jgi:hypothetical protein
VVEGEFVTTRQRRVSRVRGRLTAMGSELIIEWSSGSVSQRRIPFFRGSQYIVEPRTRATAITSA